MSILLQDLRFGLRMLAKNPAFTAAAVITLALGIGANSAMFSVVSAVLFAPPPVREPDRVVVVGGVRLSGGWRLPGRVSTADFADWRAQNDVFEAMVAAGPRIDMDLALQGAPQPVSGLPVTADFFEVLGIKPALGRAFVRGEDEVGRGQEAILSDALWRARFAADPRAIGSNVKINGASFTVIGVMPAGLDLGIVPTQLWFPLTGPPSRQSRSLLALARLKPTISVEQASAEMATIAARLARDYPDSDKGESAAVMTLRDYRAKQLSVGRALTVLMAAVAIVLLIACSNVTGLLLARAASRRQELAIRAAVGAGRGRLLRQLIAESLLLGMLGSACGLLLAWWCTRLLPPVTDFDESVHAIPVIDGNVLGFAMAISVLAVALFGLAPAFQSSGADPQAVLKSGGRTGTHNPRRRARRVLVGVEIALAVVLLGGASILVRAIIGEFTTDFGFNPQGIWSLTVLLHVPQYQDSAKQLGFFRLAAERVATLPGISSVTVVNGMPVAGANAVPFSVGSEPPAKGENAPYAAYYDISSNYFETMQIRLLRGHAFTESDRTGSAPVAIINKELAQRYLRGWDPIGRYITIGEGTFATLGGETTATSGLSARRQIVGVVDSVKDWIGQPDFYPQVYVPMLQIPLSEAIVAFRWRGERRPSDAAIVRALWSAGSEEVIVSRVESMDETIDKLGGSGQKLMGKLMATFAGLALLLAAIGVYGVVAYAVTHRTQEIGIRMALGAGRASVLALVLRETASVGVGGLVIGIAAAVPLPRLLSAVLEGLPPHQMPLLAGVAVVIASVVLLASYIPARRATKVDPMVALRHE